MLKSIKKSLKYLSIMAGIIIVVPTFSYLIIRIPEVQTFIINRITSHFSEEIKSKINVGKIEFSFFNKLTINDLIIKDINNDTLIYSQKISAGIRKLDFKNMIIKLGRVELTKPVIGLITDSTGVMNLTLYLEMLGRSKGTDKQTKSSFEVTQIEIRDATFSLINRTATENKMIIDMNNLHVTGINGRVDDFKVQNDSTVFHLNNLGFSESSGFRVNSMNSNVVLAGNNIIFNSVLMNCDSTILNADHISIKADSSDSFKRFTDEVRLDILLQKSIISSSDLQYFLPFLKGSHESVWLSGRVFGTISELKGRNIELSFRDFSYLNCDFDFSGLPGIENAFIFIGVNSLKTNATDIEKIRIPSVGNIVVPDVLYKLGNITFDGSFTGFTTDFVTYGKITSGIGNIRTDISLRPEEKNRYKIKGLVTGNNIDLGAITGNHIVLSYYCVSLRLS